MTMRPPILSCCFSESGISGPPGSARCQFLDALDGIDIAGDFGQHGRRITGSGAYLQHFLAPLQGKPFNHECNDVRLRDCLARLDRQR
jgi:hypothetical protein